MFTIEDLEAAERSLEWDRAELYRHSFTRADYQAKHGLSESGATKRLRAMVAQGKIRKLVFGCSKETRYQALTETNDNVRISLHEGLS